MNINQNSGKGKLIGYIIIGIIILSIVVVCIVNVVKQNQNEKYNGKLRNFATETMSKDFTNVYADVISIEPKHYVYKYMTNRTGIKLNDGDLTEIVCECKTVEGKNIYVSFFYWECPAYNSFQDDEKVEYSIENPLRITGYVEKASEVADDLDNVIGEVFVLFSQETQNRQN